MRTVKFLTDYRGELTNENYYTVGTVASLPDKAAAALVEYGRAAYHADVASTATIPDVEEADVMEYDTLTVAELREVADEMGIAHSGLRKAELLEAIRNG